MNDVNDLTYEELMAPDPTDCPECGAPMILRTTTKYAYPNGDPRKFYGCTRYPDCKGTRPAHPDGTPYGIPGDAETKAARKRAHQAFDPLWQSGTYTRTEAYYWLAQQLGQDSIHISECDVEMCEAIVALCEQHQRWLKRFA